MQLDAKQKYSSTFAFSKHIFRNHGSRVFFKGFLITMIREVPAFAIYFGTFDAIYKSIKPSIFQNAILKNIALFTTGGVAGIASWYFTYPLDVVKTKVQQSSEKSSSWSILKNVYKNGSVKNDLLLKSAGMKATILRAFVCNAVTFGSFKIFMCHMFE